MRIGILGSGLMGGKLGTIFAKAGHDVVFSYARSQRKLNRLAREAGRRAAAGTPREAAEGADVLLLAVHWSRVNDVLKQAGDLSGKVLITCSMPMNASDTALVIAHTSSGVVDGAIAEVDRGHPPTDSPRNTLRAGGRCRRRAPQGPGPANAQDVLGDGSEERLLVPAQSLECPSRCSRRGA